VPLNNKINKSVLAAAQTRTRDGHLPNADKKKADFHLSVSIALFDIYNCLTTHGLYVFHQRLHKFQQEAYEENKYVAHISTQPTASTLLLVLTAPPLLLLGPEHFANNSLTPWNSATSSAFSNAQPKRR
jgi:hypothetical protein